jgi:hypothetical protein
MYQHSTIGRIYTTIVLFPMYSRSSGTIVGASITLHASRGSTEQALTTTSSVLLLNCLCDVGSEK